MLECFVMLNNKRKQQNFRFLLLKKPLFIAIILGLFLILSATTSFAQVTIVAPPPVINTGKRSEPEVIKKDSKKTVGKKSNNKPKGKPEEKIHFYSDPYPLVRPTTESNSLDPELIKLEQAWNFPQIDAPAGLYDFNYSNKNLKIVASHSFQNKNIKSGQTIVLDFLLSNPSSFAINLKEKVTAHKKIRPAFERTSFLLGPGENAKRHIALFLDSSLAPGIYEIVYQAFSNTVKTLSEKVKFRFAVKAFPCLKFKRTSSTRIKANSVFNVTGKLQNCGNLFLHLDLSASSKATGLQVVPSRISLPAGSHSQIEISGKSPALSHPLKNVLSLFFTATARTGKKNIQLMNEPIKLLLE